MPFPMKIQPIDAKSAVKSDLAAKPAPARWRLKRLFERQFPKLAGAGDGKEKDKDDAVAAAAPGGELEPASVCLDKLVVNFMEDNNERPAPAKSGRCNCFNAHDSSDDEFSLGDAALTTSGDAVELLKGLVLSESVAERNLLADASKIVETSKGKIGKGKDDCIKIVTENLRSSGYDASICKSKWEKSPLIPAGEYEYIDVVIGGDRLILDVDFRSEFEIARSTKNYRAVLQCLPVVFVGRPERVQRIVAVVSEAARTSLKKKGLHFPPWRKLEYMKSKWLAPHERLTEAVKPDDAIDESKESVKSAPNAISSANSSGEVEMRGVAVPVPAPATTVSEWTPPAVKPRSAASAGGARVVTGLSSVLTEPSPPAANF